jgi:hypothetical protein
MTSTASTAGAVPLSTRSFKFFGSFMPWKMVERQIQRTWRFRYLLILVLFLPSQLRAEKSVTKWRVTDLTGQAFFKDRPDRTTPTPLAVGSPIPSQNPVLLIAAKDSLLEIATAPSDFLRLGRSTVAEFSTNKIRLHQGSFLRYCETETIFALSSKHSDAGIRLHRSALMAEATGNGGLKIVLVSGAAQAGTDADGAKTLHPGQLLFVRGNPAHFGDLYDLDLPLLLRTSRLVNGFARPLPNLSRMRTSALIQGLNLKKRYEALVGDAPDDEKVQMWAIKEK